MSGTVPFDQDAFTRLLSGEQSWALLYFPATLCPCRDRGSNSPTPACKNCLGYGYTWTSPAVREFSESFYAGSETKPAVISYGVPEDRELRSVVDENGTTYDATLDDGLVIFGEEEPERGTRFTVTYRAPEVVRGSVTNLNGHREWREGLELDPRDLHLTVDRFLTTPQGPRVLNPAWEMGEKDRFLVTGARLRQQEILYRGERERLTYAYVFDVARVYTLSNDFVPQDFEQGVDFRLEDGAVVWLEGRGPQQGKPYAVCYTAAPEFYVHAELSQARHQGGKPLPRQVMLRLWELWPRPGASFGRG